MFFRFLVFTFFLVFNLVFTKEPAITIALLDEPFYNLSFNDNPSLNDSIKKIFINDLKLNVTFKEISYKNLKEALEKNEIDGVALIPKNDIYDKHLYFSESIYSEELFVVSQNQKLFALGDLNGKIIYTPQMESYRKILDAILDNNDLRSYLIPVDNLDKYKDNLILTSTPVMYKPKYGINVSKSTGVSIALTEKYKYLLPKINTILKNGFREYFLNRLISLNKAKAFNNFYESLTPEEKKYLNSLSSLNVVYENASNTLISYKSEISGSYKGIAPKVFRILQNNLHINFIDVTDKGYSIDSLNNKDVDIMLLSKTQERVKDFIFSNKISELGVYVINLESNPNTPRTVGVLKNSVEQHIARRYDVDSNIITFDNFDDMVLALNKGDVGNLLVTNKEFFDANKYNITFFESIPINLTFNKNNVILRDIIDKAFRYIINIPRSTDEATLERELENRLIYQKNKQFRNLLIYFSILFIFIILGVSSYLYKEKLHKKTLLVDSLTGLPNRFIFDKFCKEYNYYFGYTFVIDLNNFKQLNDSLGHGFGDIILKEFANFLKNSFITDHIFRISGDEFYGFSFESIDTIVERLSKYREFCPTLVKNSVTFNLGICAKSSKTSLIKSFKYADLAMLETKKDKNSFYKIADKDFIEKMDREGAILQLLKEDISGIYPVFQPKYSLEKGSLIGAEALARCDSKEMGTIAPFEFIPIAEKYNFIHKVDYKIAKESIVFVKKLLENKHNLENFKISFNISIKTFKRDDLIDIISGLLKAFDVPGKYFEAEITESIFVLDMKDLITKLKELKKLGIQISLDDFTAGHSTAGLLPLLPIDVVKLDKSLLDSRTINKEKGEIVFKNLTTLIKDLNFKIVAEGVEDEEQVQFLKDLHIDYAQGFYFKKPITENEFIEEVKFNNDI
ncbi:EAL domain-containing protein [Candidatus Cetobacterium colombiensis]|uniref:EAL domain-containing protein n=1 Tax=Candidatus Cetobacterium colombiensis TaxID=3073100 RepID=A0ABU4W9M3_9FUSO|nr:EAL domain-containing protein [Candidatus Cetobacterium colombiensis]MDX8335914.1 EAL domain-containing protein [Candidatus Cetobacterium colombiensis]